MKRFTETTKWSDPWYQDLSPENKLLWNYLCDSCDSCGVWKVNVRLANFQLGFEVHSQTVLELFGKRIHVLSPEKWFLTSFVKFQYGELSEDCRPHKPILELVKRHGLERVLKDYQSPTGRAKDKTRQDKDALLISEGEPEGKLFPASLDLPEFRAVWIRWEKHRKEIKHPLTPEMTKASLEKLSKFSLNEAIEIIKFTLEKGWQGLAYDHGTNHKNTSLSSGNSGGNTAERRRIKGDECRDEGITVPIIDIGKLAGMAPEARQMP